MVEFLCDAGLKDISPVDRWGNTPLDDARRGGFENLVTYLKEKGAVSKKHPNI